MRKNKINWKNNKLAKMDLIEEFPTIESDAEALDILCNYLLGDTWYGEGGPGQCRYQMVDDILTKYSKTYVKEMKHYKKWLIEKRKANNESLLYDNVVEEIRKEHNEELADTTEYGEVDDHDDEEE